MPKLEKKVKIANKLGLHARPAALLVQTASKFSSIIELETSEMKVNAKSIMGVLMLAAAFNSLINIIAEGDDAGEAITALETLINDKFDEE